MEPSTQKPRARDFRDFRDFHCVHCTSPVVRLLVHCSFLACQYQSDRAKASQSQPTLTLFTARASPCSLELARSRISRTSQSSSRLRGTAICPHRRVIRPIAVRLHRGQRWKSDSARYVGDLYTSPLAITPFIRSTESQSQWKWILVPITTPSTPATPSPLSLHQPLCFKLALPGAATMWSVGFLPRQIQPDLNHP